MKQYLVETKTKAHLIDADYFKFTDIMGGRKSLVSLYKNNGEFVAAFNASDVKAVIEQ